MAVFLFFLFLSLREIAWFLLNAAAFGVLRPPSPSAAFTRCKVTAVKLTSQRYRGPGGKTEESAPDAAFIPPEKCLLERLKNDNKTLFTHTKDLNIQDGAFSSSQTSRHWRLNTRTDGVPECFSVSLSVTIFHSRVKACQNATLCIRVAYFVVNTRGCSAGVFTQAAINNPSVWRGGQVLRGITGKKGGSWKRCSQQEEDASHRLRVAPLSRSASIRKMQSRLPAAFCRGAAGAGIRS